jgi:hypothetical protein
VTIEFRPTVNVKGKKFIEFKFIYFWIRGSHRCDFFDVTQCSPIEFTDISEEHTASIFRAEE